MLVRISSAKAVEGLRMTGAVVTLRLFAMTAATHLVMGLAEWPSLANAGLFIGGLTLGYVILLTGTNYADGNYFVKSQAEYMLSEYRRLFPEMKFEMVDNKVAGRISGYDKLYDVTFAELLDG